MVAKGIEISIVVAAVLTAIVTASPALGALVPAAALLTLRGITPYVGYMGASSLSCLRWLDRLGSRTAQFLQAGWKALSGIDVGEGISVFAVLGLVTCHSFVHSPHCDMGYTDRSDTEELGCAQAKPACIDERFFGACSFASCLTARSSGVRFGCCVVLI